MSDSPRSKFDEYIADFRDATLLSEPIEDELRHLCWLAYSDGVFDALHAVLMADAKRIEVYTKLTHAGDVSREE